MYTDIKKVKDLVKEFNKSYPDYHMNMYMDSKGYHLSVQQFSINKVYSWTAFLDYREIKDFIINTDWN